MCVCAIFHSQYQNDILFVSVYIKDYKTIAYLDEIILLLLLSPTVVINQAYVIALLPSAPRWRRGRFRAKS